ncbi:HAD family hydrolase [Saccharothrix algeriensis]|uniref:Cof subfamily protein (Haloacid dehalogenase superfamily) n=1 Tax=Saccharothrix algeriensis TaxID=173560 RepID=A0A8T8I4E8_9PSEU|nr:HAD family hydrolase [Saccharothrix algeriensis]MBM7812031.1 Cof subfamily protein (haloacid dehalogenase superfamily) [Saccharothrix algeriensis]QTR05715.1 HAD family phosphatase [Saccharothrix algeriensis]
METPRLVASDVDGTLLGPDHRVSARTAGVVAGVRAAGVPFVLATGRPPRWVTDVAAQAGATGYAVCANGAVLYDVGADRVLWRRELDPVLLGDLADALGRALPGCAVAAERVGDSVADPAVAPFVAEPAYRHAWPGSDHSELSRAEVLGVPAVKLLVRHAGMTSVQLAEAAEAVFGEEVCVTYSSNAGLIEVSAAGVTKADGLADVAERLAVEPSAVVAFGDMPNDIAMLGWAGHGVAMANAHPDVLEVADEVTAPNSEDGVARLLERWFPLPNGAAAHPPAP